MKKILLLLLSLSLISSPAWATNWCDDSNSVLCLTFETGSGSTADDLSPINNDGIFVDSPSWTTTTATSSASFNGTSNYALSFDGSNDGIYFSSSSAVTGTGSFGVAVWFSVADQGYSANPVLVSQRNSNYQNVWGLSVRGSDDKAKLYQYVYNTDPMASSGTITYGNWTHIGIGRNSSTNKLYVYTNGIAGTEVNVTPSNLVSDSVSIGFNDRDNNNYVNGTIDELLVIKDILDSTDIDDIMRNGLVQGTPPASTLTRPTIMMW